MLKLGASKPWQDAMEAMTGQRDVLATPLLNYFEPLMEWLKTENAKNGDYIGWDLPSTLEESPITIAEKVAEKEASYPKINREAAKYLAPIFEEALHSLRNIRF
jgi:hypothetical protein